MTSEYGTETTCPAKLSWLYKTDQNSTCPVKPDQKDPALSEFIDLAKIENDAKLPNQVECNADEGTTNKISCNKVLWTNTPGINAIPVGIEYTVELVVANGGYLKYTGTSYHLQAREIDLVFVRCFSSNESQETIDHDTDYESSMYITIKTDKHESSMIFPEAPIQPTGLYLFGAKIVWDAVELIQHGVIPSLPGDESEDEN